MTDAGDGVTPASADATADTPAVKRQKMVMTVEALKEKTKGGKSKTDQPNKGKSKGDPNKGKGKSKAPKPSSLAPMALFPTSLAKLGLSLVMQDEDLNIMLPPGNFGVASDLSLALDTGYSAMQKSDKVKSAPFIELLSDMSALGTSNLENYVSKENPVLFQTLPTGDPACLR